MCGLFYVDDKLEREIERVIRIINRNVGDPEREEPSEREVSIKQPGIFAQGNRRDVHPTDRAEVIFVDGVARTKQVRWGLRGYQKNQLIINARSESALSKQSFREGMLHRRILIPASGFYEWNKRREKNLFTRADGCAVFMAGLCAGTPDDERFTILTTPANVSMRIVHDRMPLILEEDDLAGWLFDASKTEMFLRKVPVELLRSTEYEQMTLFHD